MKRLALVAAVFALAACSTKEQAPAADTTTPAMTPAPAATPAPTDTGMKMDSTMKHDSTAAAPADTTKKP
jgi:uncharacterized lipoprotein YajG